MKFLSFYEDLLLEERPLSNSNLDKIVPKLPQYIFDELSQNPRSILSLPQINFFKNKLSEIYGDDYDLSDPEIILLGLEEHMDTILERGMNAVQQTRFIKQVQSQYPRIDEKIKKDLGKFGKYVPGGRGRPPKQKTDDINALPIELRGRRLSPLGVRRADEPLRAVPEFNPDDFSDVDFTPEPDEVTTEPKRRGRPKQYDDSMSAMQRWKIKKEGPDAIDSLQKKHDSIKSDVDKQLDRMRKIMLDIETRKKYFGLE
jgi:hypothetical protein